MDVGNTFKSGETFWGPKAGTRDRSNEHTVCIKEVKSGSETIPLLDPNNGVDCGVVYPRPTFEDRSSSLAEAPEEGRESVKVGGCSKLIIIIIIYTRPHIVYIT